MESTRSEPRGLKRSDISGLASTAELIAAARARPGAERDAQALADILNHHIAHGTSTFMTEPVSVASRTAFIVERGGSWFKAIGTDERNTGPKLYCISGHVAKPGVYELPFGATLEWATTSPPPHDNFAVAPQGVRPYDYTGLRQQPGDAGWVLARGEGAR